MLLAYGMYFPNNRVMLLFPPIPMPARVFVFVYAVIELFLGVTGTQEGVAHFAHLGGMVGGFVMLRYWRGTIGRCALAVAPETRSARRATPARARCSSTSRIDDESGLRPAARRRCSSARSTPCCESIRRSSTANAA